MDRLECDCNYSNEVLRQSSTPMSQATPNYSNETSGLSPPQVPHDTPPKYNPPPSYSTWADTQSFIRYDVIRRPYGSLDFRREHGFLDAQALALGSPVYPFPTRRTSLPTGWDSSPSSWPSRPQSFPSTLQCMSRYQDFPFQSRVCKFCKNNGETSELYRSHVLRNTSGLLVCPVLREHVCEICGQTGDQAHTKNYCPSAKEKLREALPLHLRRTARQSDGQLR